MRAVDAPGAGWYPDPENRSQLRWWDGLDWTGIRRAVPSNAELIRAESLFVQPPVAAPTRDYLQHPGISRAESQQLIAEVRTAAREEINRAADLFSARASAAVRDVQPLITEYTNQIIRWIKLAAIVATILLVGWFVFQVIFQASLFEWIGDRIDSVTNRDGGG